MIQKIIIVCICVCASLGVHAQEKKSRNRVTYSYGIGKSEGKLHKGVGNIYSVGYERALWKESLRFTYQFSYGIYDTKTFLGIQKQMTSGYNVVPKFELTLFTIKNVSLYVGGGGVFNRTKGLTGNDDDIATNDEPEYFEINHFGYSATAGIRYGNPKKRIFYELVPWDIHGGTKQFKEYHGKFVMGIRL